MKKSHHPGRNDPCPCGSGKRYKHCCACKSAPRANPLATTAAPLRHALALAYTHLHRGHPAQAEALCQKIIAAWPDEPQAWHLLGIIALHQGNIALALPRLEKALLTQPRNPELLGNLGYAHHERGDLAAARRYYRKALAIAPDYANTLFNQHALLMDDGDIPAALANLRRLLRHHPADSDARYMLGVILDYTGDSLSAAQEFALLARGSPRDRARLDAWEYLKSAARQQSRILPITGSMRRTFEQALAAAPKQGLVLEFGVRFGNSINQLARLVGKEVAVHGFDSFQGLPEVWHHEAQGSYTTQGEIPPVPVNVKLHVGWFEQTLPEFLKAHAGPVRLLNVDCDLYRSSKTVLTGLAPRMVAGSVLVFDEYIGNEHWREDEFRALQEAAVEFGWRYEYLCFSVYTKQVAVRLTKV